MGIGELIFILIFVLFGLFNLVVRVLVSRARRRKQIAEASRMKQPAAEEPTGKKMGVKERILEVRQFLEGRAVEAKPPEAGSLEARPLEMRSLEVSSLEAKTLETRPQNAQFESGHFQPGTIETSQGEERPAQEQHGSMVRREFQSFRDREYQAAENFVKNVQEATSIELEKQVLPSLDVSISGQQLSGSGPDGYGGMDFQERVHRGGWERIQNLPPLKKAIVLSELLGKPKAMEEKNILD